MHPEWKKKKKEVKACPNVPQAGRQDDTVSLGAQTQNPQHCQHPLAEHFHSAASIQAWARWRPLAQVHATSSKESCSPLRLLGTYIGSFTLKFLSPAPKQDLQQLKVQFQGTQSERQPRSTLFSARPITKILALLWEDTFATGQKQHPLQTPCGSLYILF